VGYFDWHAEPGYYRDVTRHFPRDARVLDVGCGSAWLARHFTCYTGVDASTEAADAAAEKGRRIVRADVDEAQPV
jgi:SAM-dependent methyltransferase